MQIVTGGFLALLQVGNSDATEQLHFIAFPTPVAPMGGLWLHCSWGDEHGNLLEMGEEVGIYLDTVAFLDMGDYGMPVAGFPCFLFELCTFCDDQWELISAMRSAALGDLSPSYSLWTIPNPSNFQRSQ